MLVRVSFFALATMLATPALAQAVSGAAAYAPCGVCHTINKGGRNGVGPNLYGVIGRKAGTAAGFAYSPAMKKYAKTWTPAALDAYLVNPRAVVPGTKMVYPGIKDPAKRAAIIAFMKAQ